jgi:hypothetical protein
MTQARTVKRCSGCGLVQPLGEFDANPRARDGRASHCKGCRRVRQRAQGHPWARKRAQRWLALQHPGRWAERYRVRKRQARAELLGQAKRAQSRAWGRALADLQAEFPEQYAARYRVELAAYRREHGYEQPLARRSAERVDRTALLRARAAALEALAFECPEQAERLVRPVLAGLPADASEATRAAARLLALDRLRALHPQQFQARYAAELARHAGQEPPP